MTTLPEWVTDDVESTLDNMIARGNDLKRDPVAWEQCKDIWNRADQLGEISKWAMAKTAFTVCKVFGEMTYEQFGKELDRPVTASWIAQNVKVYEAFPTQETRIEAVPISTHIVAAYTEEPEKTLNMAYEDGLSSNQLKKKIRGETTPPPQEIPQNGYELVIDHLFDDKEEMYKLVDAIAKGAHQRGYLAELKAIFDAYESN